jgi:pimeloyl-ACP methyl ester carboxylesterase
MRRTLLKAGTAAVGVLGLSAATNRVLSDRAGELAQPLPGETKTDRWRGLDVSYTEAGDRDDRDLLLLHGINAAGTSREFEPIFDRLAENYHVVAPDLPGFGLSDRPPLVYSGSLYESFVREFAGEVTENPVCVAVSLTAAYALGAADEVDFDRLVLVCPTATTVPGRRLWVRTLMRSPVLGQAVFNLIASKPSISYFEADHGYYDPDRKPDGMADYQWQTAHQRGARYAPASFVSGYLDSDLDVAEAISNLAVPVTLVWGREADLMPLSDGRDLAETANCRLVVVDYAKLQPHAEHPDAFLELLDDELAASTRESSG